jgi:hypothetical protein
MQSPFALEVYARDVMRNRLHEAAQEALAAQLPRSPTLRPGQAARLRLANGLRALAVRLDPCAISESALVVVSSR